MASLQDVQQKTNDLVAAIGALSSSIDVMKASHNADALSPANQTIVDSAAGTLDQALAAVSAAQVKVNNP